jgi:uncharacterized RDD family membrane protein YckC
VGTESAALEEIPASAGAPPRAIDRPLAAAVPFVIAPSPYAGFWLRVLAYLIDNIIIGVVFGILILIGIAIVGVGYLQQAFSGIYPEDNTMPAIIMLAVVALVAVATLVSWLYYAWMESSDHQGTLGKMALGLIVTDADDRRITFGRATGRFFSKIITGLIPLGIGYAMAGFTEKKQALHDMIASTLVLRRI